jgi:hypothetical protein
MLSDRIALLGTGYTHYWYISASFALLKSAMLPDESSIQKQHAIDRVARQYSLVLKSQEEFVKAKEKVLPVRLNKARNKKTCFEYPANSIPDRYSR